MLPVPVLLPLAAAKPPADLQARLDAWIAGQPGGVAVAWVDAEGAVFQQAGKFSADDARPITPDTQFEIGSVTKVFTALLLAESERAGKVSREHAAAKFLLPAVDPTQGAWAKITLRALASHTAGLPPMPANITAGVTARPDDPYATYDRGRSSRRSARRGRVRRRASEWGIRILVSRCSARRSGRHGASVMRRYCATGCWGRWG